MTALPQDLEAELRQENARLLAELRTLRDRLTGSAEILRAIANGPGDAEQSLQQVAETTARLFGASSVTIRIARGDEWGQSIYVGAGSERIVAEVSAARQRLGARNLPSTVLGENRQVHIPDLDNPDPAIADWPGIPPARAAGTRAMAGTPLRREGKAIGVLIVHRDRPEPFAAEELALQQSFADQAVIAIENARLFNETKEALERQTATADILKVIASSPSDVQPVFEAIATSSNRLIGGFSTAVLRLVGDALHLVAFTSTSAAADEALKASFPRPLAEFPSFQLVRGGEAVQFNDTESEDVPPVNRELARLRGYRSMLFTPLMSNGALIGMISVTRKQPGKFAEHHVQLLKTFADQAVIAIENVRLFDEVQARTKELSQSLNELRTAQDRLVQTEKLASLGQLTAGIAHEIKNPLNFVNNFSALSAELTDELNEVLKSAALGDKVREEVDELTGLLKDNLRKVVQHGTRADSIVKNMLLHSREGAGEHRPTDINALLDESLTLAYHGARAEKPQFNVTLRRDFDQTAGKIELFPQEITRVFLNLIANGFYAVSKRKTEIGTPGFEPVVSATTSNRGDTVEIRIRDNGTGIAPDVKEKMFNPFFTTKPAGEGTGLGLSISHDIIVKQHGGRIDVDTEPGKFTEFTIVLPRTSNSSSKIRGQT
jgi:two-component system, NtrC family, sensor kinase